MLEYSRCIPCGLVRVVIVIIYAATVVVVNLAYMHTMPYRQRRSISSNAHAHIRALKRLARATPASAHASPCMGELAAACQACGCASPLHGAYAIRRNARTHTSTRATTTTFTHVVVGQQAQRAGNMYTRTSSQWPLRMPCPSGEYGECA